MGFDGHVHKMDIRIYYNDTDAGGVVYHGSYLDFGERARTEFLRDMGYHHSELLKSDNIIFVVRRAEVDYLLPGKLDDLLVMETFVSSIKNSSFVMKQVLKRRDEVLADMDFVLVCIDATSMRPVKIPASLKVGLEKTCIE